MAKKSECCPKCSTMTFPNDKAIQYTSSYVDFFVRIWKYNCEECGWVWANELQRKHNEKEYVKRLNATNEMGFYL